MESKERYLHKRSSIKIKTILTEKENTPKVLFSTMDNITVFFILFYLFIFFAQQRAKPMFCMRKERIFRIIFLVGQKKKDKKSSPQDLGIVILSVIIEALLLLLLVFFTLLWYSHFQSKSPI
jgi:hypothetical protein